MCIQELVLSACPLEEVSCKLRDVPYSWHMDNKRIVFIKLIKNCKPNHSLISSLAWAGLIIISRQPCTFAVSNLTIKLIIIAIISSYFLAVIS